jgi:hypothetical protein
MGFLNLMIILSVMYLSSQFESPERAKASNSCSKALSVVVQVNSKVIFLVEIVLLSEIFRNVKIAN